MKKQILTIILGILLIGIVNAVAYNLTSGESQSFDIGESYNYYSIIGNSTEIDLNVSQEGTIVTIIPNKYSLNNIFTIIFFNKEKEVITQYSGGGGGGGTVTKYINKTEYKNIPTYIDKEVIKEIEKEVPKETIIERTPREIWYSIIIMGITIIGLVFFIKKLISKVYSTKH